MIHKTRIFLVRHGQTEWNLQNRIQGHKNSSLTKIGEIQAYQAKETLSQYEIHAAYVSPLKRAEDTMKIILEGRDIKPIQSSNLKEIDLGPWEGKTKEETKKSDPKEYENFWNNPSEFSLPGAETYHHLQKRFVNEINAIFLSENNKTILIVSHWIAIKVAFAYFVSIPINKLSSVPDLGNGEFITLLNQGSTISVEYVR
jgi:broad specificity phosphatase PhoE